MNQLSPATSVRYHVLMIVCVLAVLAYINRLGFSSSQPLVSRDLDFDTEDVGWLSAMFLMAYALFEMPWGMLADRWGARHLLPALVVGWSLVTACAALAAEMVGYPFLAFVFLLHVRLFFGMFQAGAFPVISRIMADWIPRQERGFAQGCIWMSTRLGATVLPLLMSELIVRSGNWQVPFLILGSLGLVWAVTFWCWFRNRPEEMPAVNEAERAYIARGRTVGESSHGSVPWRRMLSSRSVWALCFAYGFCGFASNFYVTMLPTFLRSVRDLTDDERKWMESLPFLCGAWACLTGGWLSDLIIRRTGSRKWGRRLPGMVGLFLGGLGWAAIPSVEEPPALGFVLCLVFFCNDLVIGPAWASCADIGGRHAGTLGGAMNMIGSVLGATGAWLAGRLFKIGQSDLTFYIYAGSFWLAAVLLAQVDVTQTLAEEEVRVAP